MILAIWKRELARSRTLCFKHVWQIFDASQNAAQLSKITDFNHKFYVRHGTVVIHRDIRNIDVFALQQGGNITHQSLTVVRFDSDLYWEGPLHLAPIDLQQALSVFPAQNIGTILTMDGCAASAGNIANNLIAR